MSDLISRQNAIDALRGLAHRFEDPEDWCVLEGEAEYVIQQLPFAQPEIIRCKDCQLFKTEFCALDLWTNDVRIYKAKPDDFCSRAERRQE